MHNAPTSQTCTAISKPRFARPTHTTGLCSTYTHTHNTHTHANAHTHARTHKQKHLSFQKCTKFPPFKAHTPTFAVVSLATVICKKHSTLGSAPTHKPTVGNAHPHTHICSAEHCNRQMQKHSALRSAHPYTHIWNCPPTHPYLQC